MHESAYREAVRKLHAQLGIAPDYAQRKGLPFFIEPEHALLQATEPDFYGREQRLLPEALEAWTSMRAAANTEGVNLMLVSAFRSADYQAGLIQRKLDRGISIEQILNVNAAPGYSEHHTGRAIDITTDDCPVLEEEFENSSAFAWLELNAKRFHFHLSYPRGNDCGICYEPWHWCYQA